MSLCKCSISIIVNQHKNYYEDVETYINDRDMKDEIEPGVYAEMIKRNAVRFGLSLL